MRVLLFIFLTAFFTIILTIASYIFFDNYANNRSLFQISQITPTPSIKPKPLEKYAILNLVNRISTSSSIILEDPIATTAAFTKHPFYYYSNGKKVTGLATIPIRNVLSPVIIQLRGYVERSIYKPGVGTNRSAEVFAQNGFVSLAPDFLGFAGSDMPSADVFEERFQTYTVVLDLINAIPSLPFIDKDKIGIWGHSNGGHIALTVAEVLSKPIPVTVWAPVTKFFPYSILYFTDEAEDGGKALRKKLAEFEEDYDTDQFTLVKYLDRLEGPVQLHQGTGDDAVPVRWSDEFVEKMEELEKDITYYKYSGADHNMLGAWNTVVERDIEFFKKNLSASQSL